LAGDGASLKAVSLPDGGGSEGQRRLRRKVRRWRRRQGSYTQHYNNNI